MLNCKIASTAIPVFLTAITLCSCTTVAKKEPRHKYITVQEYMRANVQAQQEQDDRLRRKAEELDRMHITGSERSRQLEIEKIAAHDDFRRKLDENRIEAMEGMKHRQHK